MRQQLKAELISIGDELLIGQVVNTNATYLSKKLGEIGIAVARITTVGDDPKAIAKAFERGWKEHDVVIVTGGLGPTHDDISKASVAKFFKKSLTLHAPTLRAVKERFKKFGYAKMPEANVGQAMIPEGFTVLRNHAGTAPGLFYSVAGKAFVILPGVPREMKWITEDSLLKQLKKNFSARSRSVIQHRTLITTGIGESSLAEMLGPIDRIVEENATLAFLPNVPLLRLRISARGASGREVVSKIGRIEKRIRKVAEKYIIGVDDETLEEIVSGLLSKANKTLSVAESCTGGMLASRIVSVAGAGDIFLGGVVGYDNSIKIGKLGVPQTVIEKYGAVSEETALAMAEGVRDETKSDLAISITGIAGPTGGSEDKPIGTVWIAISDATGTQAFHHHFTGDRQIIRERSTVSALELLRKRLVGQI